MVCCRWTEVDIALILLKKYITIYPNLERYMSKALMDLHEYNNMNCVCGGLPNMSKQDALSAEKKDFVSAP